MWHQVDPFSVCIALALFVLIVFRWSYRRPAARDTEDAKPLRATARSRRTYYYTVRMRGDDE